MYAIQQDMWRFNFDSVLVNTIFVRKPRLNHNFTRLQLHRHKNDTLDSKDLLNHPVGYKTATFRPW